MMVYYIQNSWLMLKLKYEPLKVERLDVDLHWTEVNRVMCVVLTKTTTGKEYLSNQNL